MNPDDCPHCKVSLLDADDFRREIGVEVQGVYDGVLYWQCPDCHGAWNRWPEGHGLHDRAAREMARDEIDRMHHTSCTTEECRPRTDNWDLVTCASCAMSRRRPR